MSCRPNDPLHPLTNEEREVLEQIACAQSEPTSQDAAGQTYQVAAEAAGCKSNDAVSQLVSRFNQEGLAELVPRHGEYIS